MFLSDTLVLLFPACLCLGLGTTVLQAHTVTPHTQPQSSQSQAQAQSAQAQQSHAQAQRPQSTPRTGHPKTLLDGHSSSADDASYGQYQARSPLMYRVSSSFGEARYTKQDETEADDLLQALDPERGGRHFTSLDACDNSVCDSVLRQAHSLARIKLLRSYMRDTVAMLDRLVTAVDSQIITAGDTLKKAVGSGCRAVHPVLADVIKSTIDVDRGRSDNPRTWYPVT